MRNRVQKALGDFRARQAARRRLPIWLALLMPIMAISAELGLTFVCIVLLWTIHRALHSASTLGAAFILIFFSSFFFAIAPALMLLNFLLAQIPSLRRIFDRNAEGVPGASYRAAMKALWKVAKIIMPPALALGLLGAIEPWAL
jgi:hypothetical protein